MSSRAVTRNRMLTSRTLGSVKRRQSKQGNVLLQDVDAGKPCLACKNCKEGFALHVWRKSCRNCFCKREDHDIGIVVEDPTDVPNRKLVGAESGGAAEPELKRTGRKWRKPSASLGTVEENEEEEEQGDIQEALDNTSLGETENAVVEVNDSPYAWIPEGLTQSQVEKFMDMLPPDARPSNDREGQQKRARRRLHQLPLHDMDASACSNIDQDAMKELETFVNERDNKDIAKGDVAEEVELKECAKCLQAISIGDMSVSTHRLADKFFHPQCFVCTDCNQFLVDLIHFVHKGQLFCGRHHAEKILPRCGGCDELIFASTYTKAQGKNWHPAHFSCIACDRPLAAEKTEEFVQHQGSVVCLECFDSKIAKDCMTCQKKIGAGEQQLSSGDYQWHSECFNCTSCNTTLDASQFLMKDKSLYCASCYSKAFGVSCAMCKEPIDPNDRSLGAGDKKWHSKCFACVGCKAELMGKPFIDHALGLFCVACYEEKHASRCKACTKVIGSAGGIRYKEDIFHEACFVCSHCQCKLAGKKFVKKEEKFSCQDCFANKLGPKCFLCKKVITKDSEGGDSYITHESKNWHCKCFTCANCGKNLEGSSFAFDNESLSCGLCK